MENNIKHIVSLTLEVVKTQRMNTERPSERSYDFELKLEHQ